MHSRNNLKTMLVLTFLLGSLSLLFGCGGGGGTTPAAVTSGIATGSGMISGTAVKGPVHGGTVTAYAVTNGTMGAELGSGTTDGQGNFQISVGSYSGPVMLQLKGGKFTDEATGSSMTLSNGNVMSAVLPTVTSGMAGVQVTPLTSMAQAMANNMAGGMTDTNIAAANASVGTYFMVNDILYTPPMNPLVSGASGTTTQDMKNYGMAIAAMSQSAKDMGMTSSAGMVTALVNDASDGVMNGMMGSTPVAMGGMMGGGSMMTPTMGTSGLATEMATFMTSAMNRSGVSAADMQALMDQMMGSGAIQNGGGAPMNGMMSGSAFNGTMSNATVIAYAVTNGAMGAQLASAVTDSMGRYSISLGAYSGPVMLKMTGGSGQNLATGSMMSMMAGDVMTAVTPSLASGATVSVQVTPLTSMAQARAAAMADGMTDANITAANAAIGNYFMVSDILNTVPMNAALAGSGGTATADMRNYGIAVAAMAEYAHNISMTDPAQFIAAMMKDASDGIMNGLQGSTPITLGGMMGGGTTMQPNAGTSGLASAMTTFMGLTMNKSGLQTTDMQALINQLNSSNGTL